MGFSQSTEGIYKANGGRPLEATMTDVDKLSQLLTQEKQLRRFTEDVLDSRQEELELKGAKIAHLTHKLNRVQKELADAQEQLEIARAQISTKSIQLDKVKDQVFQSQPFWTEITEAEAKSSYTDLCKGVQRWVEGRLATPDSTGVIRFKSRPAPVQAYRLVSLIREPARRCIDYSETDEQHIFAVIMNYLWLTLFSRSFYCPVDNTEGNATQAWMDRLEKAMSGQRDYGSCRQWRIDTLLAITSQPEFQSVRIRYIEILSKDLSTFLAPVAARSTQVELQKAVRRSIIEPAADLAHQFHLSTTMYTLKWPVRRASSRLEVYDCKNLASGGHPIDLAGTDQHSPIRQNVSYLFDLAPGLFVERIESGKKQNAKAIVKPQVLVLTNPRSWSQSFTTVRLLWDLAEIERLSNRERDTQDAQRRQ